MLRFALAILSLCAMAQAANAQLFPNAPWNTGTRFKQASACPNGQCPDSPLRSTAAASQGHWSYPGTITNHLQGAHGVPTNGMSRAQMLDLHDALHEGTAPTMKQAVTVTPSYAVSSYAVATPGPVVVKSGGSSGGGFAVGQRDRDGYVITSIGSTISPTIAAPATQPTAQGIAPLAIGDRIAFRRSLLEAARNARKAGEITSIEFFMLSAASRNPNVLDKMQQAVHEAAIEEGLATTQAIDWAGLIDFIEKLIPIIIKLIGLFS